MFDTFTRDIDFAPDGSYFVITTTGAFGGGSAVGTMCDTSSRWENRTAANQEPTWVTYTGGDTTYGVAVTGTAVYVGGHMRWQDNPYQGDQAGPGAVPREGIAALDPVNGMPLSWNPGRTRGVGAQALYATPDSLWVGSDTEMIGGVTRKRDRADATRRRSERAHGRPGDPAERLVPGRSCTTQATAAAPRTSMAQPVSPTAATATANTAINWSARARRVPRSTTPCTTAWLTAGLYKRSFNRTTAAARHAAATTVNLYDDPDNGHTHSVRRSPT